MTNVTQPAGAPPPPNPNSMLQVCTSIVDMPIGTPVTKRNGVVQPAFADVLLHAGVTGLLSTPGPRGGKAHMQFAGPIKLTVAQWARVITNADATHVLKADTPYYLSTNLAGQITDEVPGTGDLYAPIGRALDDTCLLIQLALATTVP